MCHSSAARRWRCCGSDRWESRSCTRDTAGLGRHLAFGAIAHCEPVIKISLVTSQGTGLICFLTCIFLSSSWMVVLPFSAALNGTVAKSNESNFMSTPLSTQLTIHYVEERGTFDKIGPDKTLSPRMELALAVKLARARALLRYIFRRHFAAYSSEGKSVPLLLQWGRCHCCVIRCKVTTSSKEDSCLLRLAHAGPMHADPDCDVIKYEVQTRLQHADIRSCLSEYQIVKCRRWYFLFSTSKESLARCRLTRMLIDIYNFHRLIISPAPIFPITWQQHWQSSCPFLLGIWQSPERWRRLTST